MKPRSDAAAPQTDGETRTIAIYLRVSTDEQAESGLGLDDQLFQAKGAMASKLWRQEPVVYRDEGISGTKEVDKRPGLKALMADVRAGRVQVVIIKQLDRLGRNTSLVLDLVKELTAHDVALVSCKESFDTTTPQGQFVLTLFAALAQLERDQIAERTKGALNSKVRAGEDKGGKAPYGYVRNTVRNERGKITSSSITVDEAAARVVRLIFEWHDSGVSMREIAGDLNRDGIPSPRGRTWHHTSVREILANRGAYEGGGSRGQDHICWPRILGALEEDEVA